MNVQQVNHQIDYFIQRIRTGRIALPDFQRDFVWKPSQVVELLDSISKQWPIGSLLMLNGPQPFAFRAVDSAPDIRSKDLDLYILDGQQRVTALYHAIANVSKFCYYVDFNELANDGYEVIKWDRRSRFEKEHPDLRSRAAAGVALIKDIWDHPDFFAWLGGIKNDEDKTKFVRLREDRLTGLQSKVYHMIAIELEQGIELEALARIFETINRTGVALNAFDLLVAKLYPTKFNLRNAWEGACQKYPVFIRLKVGELEILKLVSLLIRKFEGRQFSRGVRQGDLLGLEANLIIKYWEKAIDLYAQALDECLSYGVTSYELMPSWAMVLGVAGCLLEYGPTEAGEWWKNRLVRQTFAQAANTKIVSEFDSGMKIDAKSSEPEDSDPAGMLSKPAKANGLFTKGMLGLIVARGAIDPLSGLLLSECESLTQRWVNENGIASKVTSDDAIGSVILMSEETSKKIPVLVDVKSLLFGDQALLSQGINSAENSRTPEYIRKLFGN
jgi:hypothetical protein